MTNVLFLDIDGVLNSENFFKRLVPDFRGVIPIYSRHQVDDLAIKLVNSLNDIPDLKIVVSSNWRRDSNCRSLLQTQGFILKFHDRWRTEELGNRTSEINHWVNQEKIDRSRIVVLDDSYVLSYEDRQVQTDFETGLLEQHITKIRTLFT